MLGDTEEGVTFQGKAALRRRGWIRPGRMESPQVGKKREEDVRPGREWLSWEPLLLPRGLLLQMARPWCSVASSPVWAWMALLCAALGLSV